MIKHYKSAIPVTIEGKEHFHFAVHTQGWQHHLMHDGLIFAYGNGLGRSKINLLCVQKGFKVSVEGNILKINGVAAELVHKQNNPPRALNFKWLLEQAVQRWDTVHNKEWLAKAEDRYDIEQQEDGTWVASSPICRKCNELEFDKHPITGM